MKTLISIISILVCLSSSLSASNWDKFQEPVNEFKVSFLKNATPAFFYNFAEKDGDLRSKLGIVTSIFEWRFLSADTGWYHNIDSTKERGAVVLGGNLHIDKLLSQVSPDLVGYMRLGFPDSMQKFFNKLTVGVFSSHNFDVGRFGYGLYSGLEFEF